MTDVDMQQLAALAREIGTPIWHAAVRQVWVGSLVKVFWIVAVIVAMRRLLRWFPRAIEASGPYGDADVLRLMRGMMWVGGTLLVVCLVSGVLFAVLNPTYAAVRQLTGLLP